MMQRALRGYWDRFPVSPAPYESSIASELGGVFYDGYSSLVLSNAVHDTVDDTVAAALRGNSSAATKLAVYRSALTAMHGALEWVDDSSGCLGGAAQQVVESYRRTDWRASGIAANTYLRDIIEFAVWEDYGIIDELEGFFVDLSTTEREVALDAIRQLGEELSAARMEYPLDKLRDIHVTLLIEQRMWSEMEALAVEIRERRWHPIARMALAAERRRRKPLAEKLGAIANVTPESFQRFREQLAHRARVRRLRALVEE
jgi:hypothetical protein